MVIAIAIALVIQALQGGLLQRKNR